MDLNQVLTADNFPLNTNTLDVTDRMTVYADPFTFTATTPPSFAARRGCGFAGATSDQMLES